MKVYSVKLVGSVRTAVVERECEDGIKVTVFTKSDADKVFAQRSFNLARGGSGPVARTLFKYIENRVAGAHESVAPLCRVLELFRSDYMGGE